MRKVEFALEADIEYERYAVIEDGKLVGRLMRRKRMTSASNMVSLFMLNMRRYWTMSPSLAGHVGGAGKQWLDGNSARRWITSRIVRRPK